MIKETTREEIKEETHELQDEEQEELKDKHNSGTRSNYIENLVGDLAAGLMTVKIVPTAMNALRKGISFKTLGSVLNKPIAYLYL